MKDQFALAAKIAVLVAIMATSTVLFAQATPPALINYQGVLRDAAGNPVSNGNYDMAFLFYSVSTGGTLLLTDSHLASGSGAVAVSGGLFTVALGSGTLTPGADSTLPAVFTNHPSVYLAVKVGVDAEMAPRIHVNSAPFAENAHSVDGAVAGPIGNVLSSNGSSWTSAPPSAAAGGAVVDAANTTLTRSGSGTGGDPFKLALNLSNANTWAGAQTFNANTTFPGSGIWNTSGNVGIGTTPAAAYRLDVLAGQAAARLTSASTSASVLELKNSNAGALFLGTIDFNDSVGSYPGWISYTGTDNMTLGTAGSERMRIDSSGRIGIGTTTPGFPLAFANTLGDKISLWGQTGAHYGLGMQGSLLQIYSATASDDIAFGYGTSGAFTERMRIKGNGNVGIGTGGPSYPLDVLSSTTIAINALGTSGGYFASTGYHGYAYAGSGDYGIKAYGVTAGGYFQDLGVGGHAYVGNGYYGIMSYGGNAGGYFSDTTTSVWGYVADNTYKIFGNGTVSFVQNHPTEKDKVIVYAAPEGDEVAVYTRGTAKLVNGEAKVKLGETFQWVANPDIGLTAHLTPKGDCNGLFAESVSTTEIVVKELNGGKSGTAFDYIVYGLRIGFEESSIVQEKQQESYIPSFKEHRERYAKYPDLQAYDSLERFKGMESQVRGVAPDSLDFSRAKTLKKAIHEYDPATDPLVEKLFGYGPGLASARPATPQEQSAKSPASSSAVPPRTQADAGTVAAEPTQDGVGSMAASALKLNLACFPTVEAVEAGEVIVMDPSREGFVLRSAVQADAMVVGVAAGPADGCNTVSSGEEAAGQARVFVTTNGVALCMVDAAFGPIHRGDLLISSPTSGHAMRAYDPAQGTVIGKALETLEDGTGTIKILVMLR